MNILITAANSNFAKNVIKYLLKKDKKNTFKFYGTSRTGNSISKYSKVYKVDFNNNKFPKINIIFDLIIHIAALVPRNINHNFDQVNHLNPGIFFEKLNYNFNAKFLNISSMSVYQDSKKTFIRESSPKTKNDLYGISKLSFEIKLKKIFKNKNISIVSARVPCLLVPNSKGNFLSNWKKDIMAGKKIFLSNPDSKFNAAIDGESLIDFILCQNKNKIDSYNVSATDELTILEVAKLMAKKLNKKLKYEIIPSNRPSQILIISKAEKMGFTSPNMSDIVSKFII